MFEEKTYKSILGTLLDNVPENVDKREGSIIWNALAPVALELAQTYITIDWILDQFFADTAEREYLIRKAMERGLTPKQASCAILKGKFDKNVPIGSRFNSGEYNYVVTEEINKAENTYKLQCETAGEQGNRNYGTLLPIGYISNLNYAEITELLIPGEDEEGTEEFRERYIQSFSPKAFGGNCADYKEKINAIQGVGGCKVYRTTNALGEKVGGHVKCVIISTEHMVASDELVHTVQEEMDPESCSGEGEGLAPIDHHVHVYTVEPISVNVETILSFEAGYNFETTKLYLEEALDSYLLGLNAVWETQKNLVVRISKIEAAFLEIKGILDVRNTKINGAEENLILGGDGIAVRGEIVGQKKTN